MQAGEEDVVRCLEEPTSVSVAGCERMKGLREELMDVSFPSV